jgi:hypothetical protein
MATIRSNLVVKCTIYIAMVWGKRFAFKRLSPVLSRKLSLNALQ